MLADKLRKLAKRWPNDNGDPPNNAYQLGYIEACLDCTIELLASLDAEGDGWRPIETMPRGKERLEIKGSYGDEGGNGLYSVSITHWRPYCHSRRRERGGE